MEGSKIFIFAKKIKICKLQVKSGFTLNHSSYACCSIVDLFLCHRLVKPFVVGCHRNGTFPPLEVMTRLLPKLFYHKLVCKNSAQNGFGSSCFTKFLFFVCPTEIKKISSFSLSLNIFWLTPTDSNPHIHRSSSGLSAGASFFSA